MRWKINEKPKSKVVIVGKKGPEIGDVKIKVKFAFFPIKLNETNCVWFEKYIETYVYNHSYSDFILNDNDSFRYQGLSWVLYRKNYYDPLRVKQFNKL